MQDEMARRRHFWQDFRYSHSNALASKVYCGNCGSPYRKVQGTWRCEAKLNKKRHPGIDCTMESVKDSELREALAAAFNQLPERKMELVRLEERLHWGGLVRADEVLQALEEEIEAVQAAAQDAEETEKPEINRKLRGLQGRWAEASEQRAVYADKVLQIRNLTDRIKVMEEGQDRYAYLLTPPANATRQRLSTALHAPPAKKGASRNARRTISSATLSGWISTPTASL